MPEGSRPKSLYNLQDSRSPAYINMLIYGYSGIGKTPFWGTGGSELLLIDSDNGAESARFSGSKCTVAQAFGFKELNDIYEWLRYSEEPKKKFRWVSWDGISLFMDRVLTDEIVPDAHAQNPKQSADVASQREYLLLQNRIGDYTRRFVDLPYNFGMSAHVMAAEDPEGELIYIPMIPGKRGEFSTKIAGYMNVIAYYGLTQGGTRRIITEQTGHYLARDRFNALRTRTKDGKLKGFLNNPTVPKIDELVEQKRRAIRGQDQASGRQGRRNSGSVRRG